MRWITMSLLCALGCVPAQARAQDTRDAELSYFDSRLNSTYHLLMRLLGPKDQAGLRTAQRAWLSFRDADCAFGQGDRRECQMQRTDERERQLRGTVYFDAHGMMIKLPEPSE